MTSYLGAVFFKEYSLMRPLTIRLLKDLEFQKYQTAKTELYGFARKQDLFRLVDANYIEYKTVLNEFFKTHCETSDMEGSHLEGVVFDINRLVLNFLSAVRSFLDHAETNSELLLPKFFASRLSFEGGASFEYFRHLVLVLRTAVPSENLFVEDYQKKSDSLSTKHSVIGNYT